MGGIVGRLDRHGAETPRSPATREPVWVQRLLIGVALTFITLFLLVPLAAVFIAAFRDGFSAYWRAVSEPDSVSAIKLTLLVAAVVVPANIVFGFAAAWAITRFQFPGKRVLVTVIDLPFAVSPVIAGMLFVLLFGAQGYFADFVAKHDLKIIFGVPGILLATAFVTVPFVARELIPALEARGPEQELAALTLGASSWQTFWHVTLPNIRWPLIYGAILCGARAIGEFGAVSVVTAHVRGETNTVPLHVELVYNEISPHAHQAAFAISTVLVGIALLTIVLKNVIEWHVARSRRKVD